MSTKHDLFLRGQARVVMFCQVNKIYCPKITAISKDEWKVFACAYYRPQEIKICLQDCAHASAELQVRNWNWPGSKTDRTPYGVLAHELGHHCDWLASTNKGCYHGNCSIDLRRQSQEEPLTSYCPNDAEWFAEMFRLFVTNHALLRLLKPRTWSLLLNKWQPVSSSDYKEELEEDVPPRILVALRKQFKD